jgi:signal transduction histidine kinase
MLLKVETTMSVLARNKGLNLKTNISPDMPATLTGDMQRLQQIIINLAGNAIKFTSKGEVHINLLHPNPTHWAIQVTDTGAGIPKEAQQYIFEPFRQIDNSITQKNRGSGLGLSITKQLVELMGGEINLQSEIGIGSTFTITLPIQKTSEKKK